VYSGLKNAVGHVYENLLTGEQPLLYNGNVLVVRLNSAVFSYI